MITKRRHAWVFLLTVFVILQSLTSIVSARNVNVIRVTINDLYVNNVAIGDLDGDGIDELVLSGIQKAQCVIWEEEYNYTKYYAKYILASYEINTQATIWSIDVKKLAYNVSVIPVSNSSNVYVTFSDMSTAIFDGATGAIKSSDNTTSFSTVLFSTSHDINGDGNAETLIVQTMGDWNQTLAASNATGTPIWSVQVPMGAQGGFRELQFTQLDNDTSTELILSTGDFYAYIYNGADGAFQEKIMVGDFGVVRIADINNDGKIELVTTCMVNYTIGISVYQADSRAQIWTWNDSNRNVWDIQISNLDSGADPEIIACCGDEQGIYVFASNGSLKYSIPNTGRFTKIADFDGDEADEILTQHWEWPSDEEMPITYMQSFDGQTGNLEWQSPPLFNIGSISNPSYANKADGTIAYLILMGESPSRDYFYAFTYDGYPPGPILLSDYERTSLVFGHTDGDEWPDVIVVDNAPLDLTGIDWQWIPSNQTSNGNDSGQTSTTSYIVFTIAALFIVLLASIFVAYVVISRKR